MSVVVVVLTNCWSFWIYWPAGVLSSLEIWEYLGSWEFKWILLASIDCTATTSESLIYWCDWYLFAIGLIKGFNSSSFWVYIPLVECCPYEYNQSFAASSFCKISGTLLASTKSLKIDPSFSLEL